MCPWIFDSKKQSQKIPTSLKEHIKHRIMNDIKDNYPNINEEFFVRFKGEFCYIDAKEKIYDTLSHLVRMRFYEIEKWSLDFYTYSNEKYVPCNFLNGSSFGTIEDSVKIAISSL